MLTIRFTGSRSDSRRSSDGRMPEVFTVEAIPCRAHR